MLSTPVMMKTGSCQKLCVPSFSMSHFKNTDSSVSYETGRRVKHSSLNLTPLKQSVCNKVSLPGMLYNNNGKNAIFRISPNQEKDRELFQEWKMNINTMYPRSFRVSPIILLHQSPGETGNLKSISEQVSSVK